MELQDTVAELRRELAQLKEQAEAREQEQVVSRRLIRRWLEDWLLMCLHVYVGLRYGASITKNSQNTHSVES